MPMSCRGGFRGWTTGIIHYTLTRPVERNGFGLGIADAEREMRLLEDSLTLLPEPEGVCREWRRLVLVRTR
jgi:hypothetical protein